MALNADERRHNLDLAVGLAQAGRLIGTDDGAVALVEAVVDAADRFDEHLDDGE